MFLALLLAAQPLPAARPLVAGGTWAAFDRGPVCEAVSRSLLLATKDRVQPGAAFAFDRGGARRGQFSVRLKRPARPGSSVILTVGDRPFLLVARGADAWSRGPAQEGAIIAAVRASGGMRVEARDLAGRRMVDRYALAGAPTAIDAAAAACLARR